jgi:hypothetical protein
MSYKTRTKEQLISQIVNLESENSRLTDERNTAVRQLANWKQLNAISTDDDLEALTIKAMKAIMKMSDKVRTRF